MSRSYRVVFALVWLLLALAATSVQEESESGMGIFWRIMKWFGEAPEALATPRYLFLLGTVGCIGLCYLLVDRMRLDLAQADFGYAHQAVEARWIRFSYLFAVLWILTLLMTYLAAGAMHITVFDNLFGSNRHTGGIIDSTHPYTRLHKLGSEKVLNDKLLGHGESFLLASNLQTPLAAALLYEFGCLEKADAALAEKLPDKASSLIFSRLDTDNSGMVSQREFTIGIVTAIKGVIVCSEAT